ncbi:MAG: Dot/Icm secretion system protein DotA [Pseudomonadota bacterium]
MVVILRIKQLFSQLAVLFAGFFFINELLAFDVAMSDKSRQYLGMIFGGSVGPIVLSDEKNAVIGRLFSQLNTVIFVLGTLLVGYITVVSTLNTAKEGHAMGQKWSSMWVPVRSVLGLLVMVPTPISGYSTIQVTVIWFVLQGIGAANSVWQVALDALRSGLTVTAVQGFGGKNVGDQTVTLSPSQKQRLDKVLQNTFQAAVCSKFVNRFVEINQSDNLQLTRYNSANTGGDQVSFYLADRANGKINVGFQNSATDEFKNICGQMTIKCESSDSDNCKDPGRIDTIFQSLSDLYDSMDVLADAFFSEIDTLQKPYNYSDTANNIKSQLNSNRGLYENQIDSMKNAITSMRRSSSSDLNAVLDGAKRLGWIHAGSYYMILNKLVTSNLDEGAFKFVGSVDNVSANLPSDVSSYMLFKGFTAADINGILELTNSGISGNQPIYTMMTLSSLSGDAPLAKDLQISKFFNQLLVSSSSLIPHTTPPTDIGQSAIGGETITGSMATDARKGPAGNNLYATGSRVIQTFQDAINSSSDPLLGISIFGRNLMITAETMILVAYLASVALSFSSVISCPVSFAMVFENISKGVLVPAATAGILMWSVGATFAVYIPMIPYLMFTATAIGWMFAVIEAVVAAPVLALGFVSPSGDELGKAGQGVLMLVSLFLKPTLMILSFILASRLLKAILTMVNNMFITTVEANIAGVSPLFGWVVPMVLYGSFIISLINKCFSLIHILPEKVMRWIGAQGDGFSVDDVMQKTEGKTQEGIGAAQSGGKGVVEGTKKRIGDKEEAAAKQKRDAE